MIALLSGRPKAFGMVFSVTVSLAMWSVIIESIRWAL
jgi:hypothetical protein